MRKTQLLFCIHHLTYPTIRHRFRLNSIHSRCLLHTSVSQINDTSSKAKDFGESQQHKPASSDYMMDHDIYTKKELDDIRITHRKLESWHDYLAYGAVRTLRFFFDKFTGYVHISNSDDKIRTVRRTKTMTEKQWIRRFIFLESIAGVPGMVGGMSRHMKSLRTMRRDHGWIHTLLSEAENERMHLLTFLELRQPGPIFRLCVLLGQGVFFNAFFLTYLVSPTICHRFVGFLEEEAVVTYTRCITDLDNGKLPIWMNLSAPEIAKVYWKLNDDAKIRDVLLAIRADEAKHREVNHKLADVGPDLPNPYANQNNKRKGNDQQNKIEN